MIILHLQNVSEQNQKHFLCPGHKISVRRQQMLRARANGETLVSATMSATTRTHCCGHIVVHDVSWARKLAGHKMNAVFPCCANWETFAADTKLVSATNVARAGKRGNIFCVPDTKFLSAGNKCCARGQTGKHLCRQQCVLVCQGL